MQSKPPTVEPAQDVCLRCANTKTLQGCCKVLGDTKNQLPVTMADIRRVSKYLGIPYNEVAELEVPAFEMLDNVPTSRRLFALSMSYDTKFRLKLDKDQQCVFLDDGEGCTLGDLKPLVCRVFPFWPDDRTGHMTLALGGACLAVMENGDRNTIGVLDSLGMSGAQLSGLARQIRRESLEHTGRSTLQQFLMRYRDGKGELPETRAEDQTDREAPSSTTET